MLVITARGEVDVAKSMVGSVRAVVPVLSPRTELNKRPYKKDHRKPKSPGFFYGPSKVSKAVSGENPMC